MRAFTVLVLLGLLAIGQAAKIKRDVSEIDGYHYENQELELQKINRYIPKTGSFDTLAIALFLGKTHHTFCFFCSSSQCTFRTLWSTGEKRECLCQRPNVRRQQSTARAVVGLPAAAGATKSREQLPGIPATGLRFAHHLLHWEQQGVRAQGKLPKWFRG